MTEDGGETKVLESGRLLDDLRDEESPPGEPRPAGENSWTPGRALLAAATGLGLLVSVLMLVFAVHLANSCQRVFAALAIDPPNPTYLAMTLAGACAKLGALLVLAVLAALVVPLVTMRGRAWWAYFVTSHLVLIAALFFFLSVQLPMLEVQGIVERAAVEKLRNPNPAGSPSTGSSTREP